MYKVTCYWIFWHQPFEPSGHITFSWFEFCDGLSSLFRSFSQVASETLFMNTVDQALLESYSLYWEWNKYLSTTPSHWCLGPEVAIFPPAFMTPHSSLS